MSKNEEEFDMSDFDMEQEFMNDSAMEMMKSLYENACATAISLTEIIVENNHVNQKIMTEEDIHKIYERSFTSSLKILEKSSMA